MITPKTKRILVTGAGGPAGINFVCSLRIAPEKMFVVGTEANHYFLHLARTDKTYHVRRAEQEGYIDDVNDVILKNRVSFIHAQPDVEVETVSANREKLSATTFLPSKKTISTCQDKAEATKLWKGHGVPTARFIQITRTSDIDTAFEELGETIWIRATHGAGGVGSTPATNRETAASWISYWNARKIGWKFIAQEHLPGRNMAFHSLWKEGKLIASMAREGLEYIYPHLAPSGVTGTPAVQRTIHDKKVNETGTSAVLAIDSKFSGIACVDLKENSEGTPCVTEINAGRMFTTSFFFSFASKIIREDYYANLPYLTTKLAFGEELPDLPKYDILPSDVYWIRHIDAPAKLVRNGRVIGEMFH